MYTRWYKYDAGASETFSELLGLSVCECDLNLRCKHVFTLLGLPTGYSLTTLLHSQMVRDGWIEELWLVGFIYPLKGKFLLSVHLEKSIVYVEINLEDALLHNISTF